MLDTINVVFELENTVGDYIEVEIFNLLRKFFSKGSYYDLLKESDGKSLSIRLSYPRFFDNTNAYLITTKEECLKVNEAFIEAIEKFIYFEGIGVGVRANAEVLLGWFEANVAIKIKRVDVAFTHLLNSGDSFNGYRNLYQLLNSIYIKRNPFSIPKNVSVTGNNEVETLIFSDTQNVGAYNRKIVIYNQYRKFCDYYSKDSLRLHSILQKYPDLPRRVRIEASKRIRRKPFEVLDFMEFDIFNAYVQQFADDILNNLFNKELFDSASKDRIEWLKETIKKEREYPNFNYQAFIYRFIDEIWDYELVRKAVMETTDNLNSAYQACSTIREILKIYEKATGIKFFNMKETFEKIQKDLIKIRGEK
ncbi:MAG: hypothetical protein ACRC8M_13585 [Cetobacterium sp.]|uniref:hypothetical protein n=1 Tax=Cetobacterium sp. TaxID=2071632 RepID=UPI003F2FC1BE